LDIASLIGVFGRSKLLEELFLSSKQVRYKLSSLRFLRSLLDAPLR